LPNRKRFTYYIKAKPRCSHWTGRTESDSKSKSRRRAASSAAFDSNVNEVLAVASSIASMADRDVRDRYHSLVDISFERRLTPMERFELERIDARLDAEDRDANIEALDREWESERADLLDSIEDILTKLSHSTR
jgi:hypothetical protein